MICFLLAFLGLGLPTLAGMRQVSGLFAEARYDEARQNLVTSGEKALAGEEMLWRSRLAVDPDQAAELLKSSLDDGNIPESTRIGMALQLAQIHFARGNYEQTHNVLLPLFGETTDALPGEVYLLAGLTLRKAGKLQAAREMLASVKPADPAFGAARYFLGDIGLESNDPELALRYFQSGQKNATAREFSRLKAGQWRALRASGQDGEAAKLLEELNLQSPGCLALVEIGRVLLQENDEFSARMASTADASVDTVVESPQDFSGRYALQVGAFSDRGLALEFKRLHQEQIPELEITEVRDSMGQFLYKLRFGSFVNPALARSEAQRQKKKLGMDVIVVDLDPAAGSSRR
jgi:hypothetical protein